MFEVCKGPETVIVSGPFFNLVVLVSCHIDELERLCAVHEAQLGDSQTDVSRFEVEQRSAEQMSKANGYWIPMMDIFALGVPGPSGNENVWDLVPRNVLVEAEGDIFVVDAEMKNL